MKSHPLSPQQQKQRLNNLLLENPVFSAEKVLWNFFPLFLKQPFVDKMAQGNCGVVRMAMETENIYQQREKVCYFQQTEESPEGHVLE